MCPQQSHILNLETIPCWHTADLSRDPDHALAVTSSLLPGRHRLMRWRLKVKDITHRPLFEYQTHETVIGRKQALLVLTCQLLKQSVMVAQFIHSVLQSLEWVCICTQQLHTHLRRELYDQKWCIKTAGLAQQASAQVHWWGWHLGVTSSCLTGLQTSPWMLLWARLTCD